LEEKDNLEEDMDDLLKQKQAELAQWLKDQMKE